MNEYDGLAEPAQNVPAVVPPDMTDPAEQLIAAAAGQGIDLTWAADGFDSPSSPVGARG